MNTHGYDVHWLPIAFATPVLLCLARISIGGAGLCEVAW